MMFMPIFLEIFIFVFNVSYTVAILLNSIVILASNVGAAIL